MPLVRISLMEGKSAEFRRKIGDVVHQAMVETINCPPQDRFQLIRGVAFLSCCGGFASACARNVILASVSNGGQR